MPDKENLRAEIPEYAYISLARRGMEKISLDQCFLKNCDNNDIKLLEPFKKEEYEDENKQIKDGDPKYKVSFRSTLRCENNVLRYRNLSRYIVSEVP